MADTALNVEKIVLKRDAIPRDILNLVPETIARTYNVIPLEMKGNALKIAMANITDIHALEAVESRTKMRVETVAATPDDVLAAIDFHYQTSYGELE